MRSPSHITAEANVYVLALKKRDKVRVLNEE